MTEIINKPVVFFCPGPEYLFLTSGLYYTWELSHLYNIVLLLDFPFANFDLLDRMKTDEIILDYLPVYYPGPNAVPIYREYKRHVHYYTKSRILFEKYSPAAIFQHNDILPLNIYYFEEACRKKTTRIIYKASLILSDGNWDLEFMKLRHVLSLAKKWKLPFWLVRYYSEVKRLVGYHVNYKLFPFKNTGHIFRPRLNPIKRHGRWYNNSRNYFDYSLTHTGKERKALLDTYGESSTVVKFPVAQVGDQVFKYLYGSIAREDVILILPTDGEVAYISHRRNLPETVIYQELLRKWGEVIEIMGSKMPSYRIYVKFKSQKDSAAFERYLSASELKEKVRVIPPNTDVHKLILKASVVVSTTSSVLWWANFLRCKRVLISVDVFDLPGGNYYEDVEGVWYVNDFDALRRVDFWKRGGKERKSGVGVTLTEFMESRVGRG